MVLPVRIVVTLAAVAVLSACASAPEVQTAEAKPVAKDCIVVTGSSLCKKPGTGNSDPLYSISGDDLRKSGGPITGAQPGRTGD